jgi:hypothetical protein
MYSPNRNPTELFYGRQELLLLQEASNTRLARRLRAARSLGSTRSERLVTELGRAVASWGRTRIPFFRA